MAVAALLAATAVHADDTERATNVIQLGTKDPTYGTLAPEGFGGFDFNRDFLRGFANDSALRDGHRDYGYLGPVSFTNVESIEVLKGPISALYGNGKPGGDLNTITKAADGSPIASASVALDSYGLLRAKIDTGGPLGSDAMYRFNAAESVGHSFRDEFWKRHAFVAPVLKARIDASTEVSLSAEFASVAQTWDINFLPDARLLSAPVQRFYGEPSNLLTLYAQTVRLSIDHAFNDTTSVRQAFFVQHATGGHHGANYDTYGFSAPDLISPDGTQVNRVFEQERDAHRFFVSQTELSTQAQFFGARHTLLAGVELARFSYDFSLSLGEMAPIAIDAPRYGATDPSSVTSMTEQSYGTQTQVLYVVDRIAIPRANLKALLGLRAERFTNYFQDELAGSPQVRESNVVLSPRVGLVWAVRPTLDAFASWTNSSRPQIGARSASGRLFRAEAGSQVEGGLQARGWDGAVANTLSLFSIRKRNVLTTDPSNPNFQIDSGQRTSRGIELDTSIDAKWASLNAGVSYTDAVVSHDESVPAGSRLAGVPRWAASLYGSMKLPGPVPGLSLSLGLYGQSAVQTALPNTPLQLPGYATTSLSLGYSAKPLTIQLDFSNAFNRRILKSDGYSVYPDEPRKLDLTLSYQFI
ncbi:MAG: TonB-dependent receptor [Proteobacteria bacterium]|nr:TonB-dependent receptor [Pseudomonadota bacterium]